MNVLRRALVLSVLTALALSLPAAAADAGTERLRFFKTPSGRIGCIYDSKSIRCDGPDRRAPARPRNCDVDFGGAFAMGPTGRANRICHGDTARDPRAPVLRYGRTLKRFGFTCTSRTSGLTCRNRSRHGWFISVQRTYLF